MREVFEDLQSEVRGAWRFRWPAMVVAWLICLVGWSSVFLMPDQYAAEAQFFVDPSSRIQELMKGLVVDADEASQLALVRQAMLSRPVLESVARETDLDLRAGTPKEKESLIDTLRKTVKIHADSLGGGRDAASLYLISYRDVSRNKSVDVVDTLLETFKKEFVTGQASGTDEAIEFLERKVGEYKQQLQQREQALAEFQRRNVGLLPNDRGGYFTRMQAALSDLETLEAELRIAVNRRNALRAQLPSEKSVADTASLPAEGSITTPRTELEERIVELEDSLQNLLLGYTDLHPDVVATRARLDQLYERRRREMQDLAEASGMEGPVSDNPVLQEVQIALNEASVEIASLESQVGTQRVRVADLQAKVDVIPVIEAELAELTRDYDQVNSVYKELREQLEKELLFRENRLVEGSNFRIVQPPVASLEPVAPNRPRLLIAVLSGGLLAAGGLSYLLHMLRPVFVDPRSLMKVTGLPVLGTVSMAWLSRNRTRRLVEAGSIGAVIVSLVFALVLVLVFQDAGVEAAAKVRRMALL